jgi:hypothetical protein
MPPKEIPDELIDQLLAGREGPEAITGPDGLLKQLTKRVVERAASAELTGHLGYELAWVSRRRVSRIVVTVGRRRRC